MPEKIQIYIEDYMTLLGTYHDEFESWFQPDHRSPSIYKGTTFMGIPIEVSAHDPWVRITGVYECEGEVLEDYKLESVEV